MEYSEQDCYHIFSTRVQDYVSEQVLAKDVKKYNIVFETKWQNCRSLFSDYMWQQKDLLPPLKHIVIFYKPIGFDQSLAHRDIDKNHWAINLVISSSRSDMIWYKYKDSHSGIYKLTPAKTLYQDFPLDQLTVMCNAQLDNTLSLVNIHQPHRIKVDWASRICISLRFNSDLVDFKEAREWIIQQNIFTV